LLPRHTEHPADLSPGEAGGSCRRHRICVPLSGAGQIVARLAEFAPTRAVQNLLQNRVGFRRSRRFGFIPTTEQLLQSSALDLLQFGVVFPPGAWDDLP
jgi:hypothetical protein